MNYKGLTLRHEIKYYLPVADYMAIRTKLRYLMQPDPHAGKDGSYHIRSLYFDDGSLTSAWEKESGVEKRSKLRVRVYDHSTKFIRLENKIKVDSYIGKKAATLSIEEWQAIERGDTGILLRSPDPFLHEFYAMQKLRRLRQVVAVDYRREAYTMHTGNVRVTFDLELEAAFGELSLFGDNGMAFYHVYPPGMCCMEVKFDDFLPTTVSRLIQPYGASRSDVSKYLLCLKAAKREMLYTKSTLQ